MNEKIYTIESASDMLGCTVRYLRDKIKAKEVKAYKKGKRYYLLHSDIINFIKSGKQ